MIVARWLTGAGALCVGAAAWLAAGGSGGAAPIPPVSGAQAAPGGDGHREAAPQALVWPQRTERLTADGAFNASIEGPSWGPDGALYVPNLAEGGGLGRVHLDGRVEAVASLPADAVANGSRFGPDGRLLLADWKGHRIFSVDVASGQVRLLLHEPRMHQPNDLAVAPDGTIYASDPDWKRKGGQIWRVRDGAAAVFATGLTTPNGLDLSPDGKTLYVAETVARRVVALHIGAAGQAGAPQTLYTFADGELDGLRCDAAGDVHVARPLKGEIAVISPEGQLLASIKTQGQVPTNLSFGGADGATVFVTVRDGGRVETYLSPVPGR